VDTFNPYKTLVFKLDMSQDDSIGTADFMAIWNQGSMDGLYMHWDGNNRSVDERNLSAAIGAGASPETLDFKRIERIRAWIWNQPPPAYPFEIDYDRAARGRQVYWGKGQCAGCHELSGEAVGQVVPLKYLGTDPERSRAFDQAMAGRMNTIGKGYPWAFKQFRVTDGYVNHPLDGIWLRAPYLHNGSVPTLRHLLEPADKRPEVFYKGNDVYDKANVGFVWGQSGSRGVEYFKFDTRERGNARTGHLYGVGLTKEEKDALVEYMKTL
jgi:mono/diheme cytochrome c family protein